MLRPRKPSSSAAAERQAFQTLCRMCDDHCALNVYMQEGRVVDIDGFAEHPWNRGRLCNKGRAAADLVYHRERLWKPLKRTASGWQEIPLEQALDEIAARVRDIQARHGARSIGLWKGEAVGFAQQKETARRFIHAIGSPNYFSNDSLCFNGRWIGYAVAHGAWSVPDYGQARCIALWGANPPYAHPNMTQMIMRARRRGARLVVVDPRLSAIARKADVHAAPLPGTDGALAWGLIGLLVGRGDYDRELVGKHSVGFPRLAEYARGFTPQAVEKESGLPAATVERIADLMAQASPAVVNYVGNGLEHHENGINNIRAVAYLDTLLGALDRKGGNRLAESLRTNRLTLYQERPLTELGPIGADRFPVLYGLRRECHSMSALDTMLSGRPYPLKGLLLTAANPALTNPNTDKVRRALAALELLVVRDLFLTETAQLAHYVLPAASFLERSELHAHPMFQVVGLSRKLLSFPGVQDEYQFWHDLAHRLGGGAYFPWAGERARVSSRVGSIEIPVTVCAPNEILPGTVQITHGYRQANVNLLTPDDLFDPISGFPLLKAVPVSIERAADRAAPLGTTGPRPAGTA